MHEEPRLRAATMLFDGECALCSFSARFVLARSQGRPLRFCAMQSARGQVLLRHLGLPLDEFASVVLLVGEHAYQRTEAILHLAAYMDAPWPFLATFLRAVPAGLRDWVYDRVAVNRYRLVGRRSSCLVPDAAIRARFDE